jgi:hypothetical protein
MLLPPLRTLLRHRHSCNRFTDLPVGKQVQNYGRAKMWSPASAARRPLVARTIAASKPGKGARRPVSRVLSAPFRALDGHSSGTRLATRLSRPTRATGRECPRVTASGSPLPPHAGRPYSVLLPVGFALPPPLPGARCALAAPFHPCRRGSPLAPAVCSLWHCPWGRPRRPLAGTVFPWSPDFPPTPRVAPRHQRPSSRLARCPCAHGPAASSPGPISRPGSRPGSRMIVYAT